MLSAAGLWDEGSWTELARVDGVLGELVLRSRPTPTGPLVDLLVAGVAVMDDQESASERALATLALDELERHGRLGTAPHVVVGGLGLGFTAATLLADPRMAAGVVTVVEVEPEVVAWNRAGLVPATAGTTDDPRTRVVVGDVGDVLPTLEPGGADAVLLDVDNGPGFLVVPDNARLYEPAGLAAAAAALRSGGVLAVWSAQAAPQLAAALDAVVGPTRVHRSSVVREGRELDYYVHLASRRG